MSATLAGSATKADIEEMGTASPDLVRLHAARLYGQGYRRREVARIMLKHLTPFSKHRSGSHADDLKRSAMARIKLARWEKEQEFRDLVYENAVVALDLDTPAILQGVARQAKKGRIDAARLALEVTGRHNPKGEAVPTQVAVVFTGMPRPSDNNSQQTIEAVITQAVEATDDDEA